MGYIYQKKKKSGDTSLVEPNFGGTIEYRLSTWGVVMDIDDDE